MTVQVDVETLRDWLDQGRPVTVVDIRRDEERAQWSVPGSIHVNAYDALRVGEAGALAAVVLPPDRPVVTVCNVGRVSQIAADVLAERGFDARALLGGMQAWTLAWNLAEVPLPEHALRVIQIRRTGKGCLSYLVGSGGGAAVIDPSLPPEVYLSLTNRYGWTLRYVIETHVHADHFSRARTMVKRTGAALLLPPQPRLRFPFTPVEDGERIRLGSARLTAMRTPGHTDESTCFVLNDSAVFTGDTLFVDGIGRPDLHIEPKGMRERAQTLFGSLSRLSALKPGMLVLPSHASAPSAFDGRPIAAAMSDVAGWLREWLACPIAFVNRITSNLPPAPPNVKTILTSNEAGEYPPNATEFEAGANRCAVNA
jgi:glyoxylase-like metal-dependent hydrolase (beta-lactamase superfamily II)/rhodanese-related sulfurtransferase